MLVQKARQMSVVAPMSELRCSSSLAQWKTKEKRKRNHLIRKTRHKSRSVQYNIMFSTDKLIKSSNRWIKRFKIVYTDRYGWTDSKFYGRYAKNIWDFVILSCHKTTKEINSIIVLSLSYFRLTLVYRLIVSQPRTVRVN